MGWFSSPQEKNAEMIRREIDKCRDTDNNSKKPSPQELNRRMIAESIDDAREGKNR